MPSSLFKELNQNGGTYQQFTPVRPNPIQSIGNLMTMFRQQYGANATPEQVVKSMLSSGQISQEAFTNACNTVNMLMGRK